MREDSLAPTFNALHMKYSQHFNRKKKAKGHSWQGRFYSWGLDERHLFAAIRYVENNPVRAEVIDRPEEYRWSSVGGHVNRGSDPILSEDYTGR